MFKFPRFNNLNNQIFPIKKFTNINQNLYKQFLTNNKFQQISIKESKINLNNNNNNIIINNINNLKISQIQNKNFFKKIFNKKDNSEIQKDKENEIESNKNNLKTKELKLQDIKGNINLSQNSRNANDGEYEFSHKTETQNENENENENENKENYENLEVSNLFSKEDLQVEDIGFKKSSTTINYSLDNNIHKFANLINYEMKFVSHSQNERYNKLNFEEDLVKLKEEMNKYGYNEKLIHSIFRKK
jgi:hypothetical protein